LIIYGVIFFPVDLLILLLIVI